ncbi:hypothetical protein LBMAG52_10150 [Planctomycetia bacterium]|nr:hypothetical protein LBMAG52_10150 [Planctomycetia bacterium]
MSQVSNSSRSGSLVSSQGIEWSFVWLSAGVLGLVFLFFSLLGRKSDEKTPTYDSQITPRTPRDNPNDRPEVGAPEVTEST